MEQLHIRQVTVESLPNRHKKVVFVGLDTYLLVTEKIGEGSFCKVKLAHEHASEGSTLYAVKILHKGVLERQRISYYDAEMNLHMSNNLERVMTEIGIWEGLVHPNIVRLHRIVNDPSHYEIYLVIEYCEHGQIMTWDIEQQRYSLNARIPALLSQQHPALFAKYSSVEAAAKILFSQVARAIAYLHSIPVLHKDIKPDNILFSSEDCNAKLTDFTTAERSETRESLCFNPPGTVPFQAPESMLSGDGFSGQKSDVWALGVCMFAMLNHGALPFWNTESELQTQLAIKNTEPQYPADCSEQASELLRLLLNKDPERRPWIEDVQLHPWFNLAE